MSLLVVALVATTGVVAAAQSPGHVGIRLLDAPVDRRDDPRARVAIVDHLPVLATIERRIEVSNTTDDDRAVALYAAAADATAAGWEVASGREHNDLSRMVTVVPADVVVPAGGTVEATVTLDVAADAPQREHYAVVWAEVRPTGTAPVTVVNRVGVRLYVSIGAGDEPASDFTVDRLTAGRDDGGAPLVRASVSNTGGRALDLGGELRLSEGPGGLAAGPLPTADLSTLGVGETTDVVVTLDPALPDGPWLATMTVRSGTLERVVEGRVTFPSQPDELAEPVEALPVRPGGPVGPAVAGSLLVVTGGLVLAALRRRRVEDEEPEPGTTTAVG